MTGHRSGCSEESWGSKDAPTTLFTDFHSQPGGCLELRPGAGCCGCRKDPPSQAAVGAEWLTSTRVSVGAPRHGRRWQERVLGALKVFEWVK